MEDKKILFLPRGELRTAKPFCNLFQIKPHDLKHIVEDMKKNGYDHAHPIILWRGMVVDGHTRLAAAGEAGVGDIPVVPRHFKDEQEALEYAIKSQSNRRNLTDAELLTCIEELDNRKMSRGGGAKASREAFGKTAEATADLLGVSRAKVERLRAVQDHASKEVQDAVATGEMSVNRAYNETMRQRRESDSATAAEKPVRIAALIKSIGSMISKRIERETQEYPEIGYSETEKEKLKLEIAEAIGVHIDSLPGTTTEE